MTIPSILYTIAMPRPHTHLYEVCVRVAGLTSATTDFVLPSWTPGSYMIREYARHVQEFRAEASGQARSWRKIAKDTWQVDTSGVAHVQVSYQVYANELTVRTSHLDGSHGYFNGATVFMFIPGRTAEPLGLEVQTLPDWHVTTGLEVAPTPFPLPEKAPEDHTSFFFVASDYDELIDCPVECGTHRVLSFTVDTIEHRIAIWGHGNEDEQRIVADTRRIVAAQRDMFGGLPYRHYSFILHLASGRGGGLEHRNSVTNLLDRWSFKPEAAYERFLGLQSHEFFHVWNAKRIRPAPLGPFDYRHENYTCQLWAVEGITSYYDNLILLRTGLITPQRYLELLAQDIVTLQNQPGRHLQNLEQSSFDAWIKFYRPDEHSVNSSVSYYLKGSLVALLLDLEIRQRSGGTHSLDDVMRYLYQTYPASGPGVPEASGYLAAVEAVAGTDDGVYRDFFARYIAGTDELDIQRALSYVGLHMEWSYKQPAPDDRAPAWLGLTLRNDGGRTVVASARTDGPAYTAGITAGDELLALDDMRISKAALEARLSERTPGSSITLTLFRRDELLHIPITLAEAPYDQLRLVPIEQPNAAQQRMSRDWLSVQPSAVSHQADS